MACTTHTPRPPDRSMTPQWQAPAPMRSGHTPRYESRERLYQPRLAYSGDDEHDRAIDDYDQAIRLDPQFANAYNNRGIAYDSKGEHDRAIVDLVQGLRLLPKYAGALNATASDCHQEARPDDAIAVHRPSTPGYKL